MIRLPQFVEDRNGDIWTAIAEVPGERLLCIPKLIAIDGAVPNGWKQAELDGRALTRPFCFSDWFTATPGRIKPYVHRFGALGNSVFLVPKEDMLHWLDPWDYAASCLNGQEDQAQVTNIRSLLVHLAEVMEVPLEAFGIEGSHLLGISTQDSDIDLFLYGAEWARQLSKRFPLALDCGSFELFMRPDWVHGFGSASETQRIQNGRRFYGIFQGQRFSIVPVPSPADVDWHSIWNRTLRRVGVFEGPLQISETTLSSLCPAFLEARDSCGSAYRIEIYNHYGVNQARGGETFFVRAPMFECSATGLRHLVLAFWEHEKQDFSLQC